MTKPGAKALWSTLMLVGFLALCGRAVLNAAPADTLSEADAITLVRQLNTAEIEIFSAKNGNHQYVSLRKLLASPGMNNHGMVGVTANDESSGPVKDYTLSVIASSDGQHFFVSLAPKGCGLAIFSNETGIVYRANAAGCE